MPYEIDLNRQGAFSKSNQVSLTPTTALPGRGPGAPHYVFYELEPAEVIDIILDEKHPDYLDATDIGKAKIRLVVSDLGKSAEILPYAKPLNPQIRDYPLIHEIVIVAEYLGEYYYSSRLNILNSPNNNAFAGLSLPKRSNPPTTKRKVNDYENVAVSQTPNKTTRADNKKLGKTFTANLEIKPLRSGEGDLILEGRFGNSIRLGSNRDTGNPTVKIRAGQSPETPEGFLNQTTEDINNDGSSLWLTTDGEVPVVFATANDTDIHLISDQTKPETYAGRQALVASDRIILNAKSNELMGFAKKDINLVAKDDFTLDTGGRIAATTLGEILLTADTNILLTADGNATITTSRINLGSEDAEEPLVLGNQLNDLLSELIDAIAQITVPTGTGPSGTPINVAQFQRIKNKLRTILSQQNYSL